jgi:hypothetical protein
MLDPVPWVNCRQELAILSANESLRRLNIEIGNSLQAQALQCFSQCYLLIKSATNDPANDKKPPGANLAAFRYSESVD